jgi:hypothetical protein
VNGSVDDASWYVDNEEAQYIIHGFLLLALHVFAVAATHQVGIN